jgi:hypothetical protein
MMSRKTLQEALENAHYIYAKTMPQCPHFYVMRKNWRNPTVKFESVVAAIEERAIEDTWINPYNGQPRQVRYFKTKTHRYWIDVTYKGDEFIINRAEEPQLKNQ